ncbi:MAG: hypothetical protein HY551_05270 [Elusimicrobia bacterium]|nr:hypothetical protein [Elusimicrobiota bacterium]
MARFEVHPVRGGRRVLGVLWLAGVTMGCVEIPAGIRVERSPETTATPVTLFSGLDPGGKDVTGLHFKVYAYGTDRADAVVKTAEGLYNRIMGDTGLYSFQPAGLYSIVVYGAHDEYIKKTQQPPWSGGITVGNAIYSYDGPQLAPILAHEMTHVLFHEYMRSSRLDLRWINEGLAVYEEQVSRVEAGLGSEVNAQSRRALLDQPMSFDRMIQLVPATERDRDVNAWYRQVGDVIRFMIERGGRNGFSQFFSELRKGSSIEEALRSGFPGVWSSLAELEGTWRNSL